MLRYSNRSIFSTMQDSPTVCMSNTNNISDPDRFNTILDDLMLNELVPRATNATSKFATAQADFTNFQKIYGLVQCSPDLSQVDCNRCLVMAASQIPNCCIGKQGGRVIQPSCNLRFEIYPFYESIASTSTPSPQVFASPPPLPFTNTTTTKGKGNNSLKIVVITVISSFILLVLLFLAMKYFYSRRRRTKKNAEHEKITSLESLQFNFDSIEAATDNFSDHNKLGKGGFGVVYKGRLSDGQEIAVKRLSRKSGQGEEQSKNEVLLVAKLHHRNLVKLLGFCIKGEERLLIYEFVPNTSLDHFIFDPIKRAHLNWETRYKIIGGIARGLLYLHEDSRHRIIHRDLKADNILLDKEMNPKISDFGLARLFVVDQAQESTDRIVGTYGYMSPEYAMHGAFSVKSDVYSFGVLLLEIVSGQKNNSFYDSENFDNLLSYVWQHWMDGTTLELVDSTLGDSLSTSEVIKCIHIGLLCVQNDVVDRPTMATVVHMLSSYSGPLSVPSPPGFCVHGRMNTNMPLSNLKPCSVNGLSIT